MNKQKKDQFSGTGKTNNRLAAQLNNDEPKIIKKECFGCGDAFPDYGNNYDYCLTCAINNQRYIPGHFQKDLCSECGSGSGWIKFKDQLLRACKLCSVTCQIRQEEVSRG